MDIPWVGNVRDLVRAVAGSDARTTYIDTKTGAKIRINIDSAEEETDEPFYIESPDGENLYDAHNRKEAIMILSNIRKGKKYPDMPDEPKPKTKKGKAKRTRAKKITTGISGSRR